MRDKAQTQKPKHITKRGHFLDDYIKMKKIVPGYLHNQPTKWGEVKDAKKPEKDAKKNTYIDQIINNRDKFPGSGAYNIIQTDKQVEEAVKAMHQKKIKYGEKGNYLSNFEALGSYVPGAGNYNPMEPLMKLVINKKKPDDWIKIHKNAPKPR